MIEHRMIDRMLAVMKAEVGRIEAAEDLGPVFIDTVVDFIRVYADRTHHGKEEEILFHDLAAKNLSPDHDAMMRGLVMEHRYARDLTNRLVEARNAYIGGDKEALGRVISLLLSITDFYPAHIAKEDKQFFPAAMDYLDQREQDAMLIRFLEFDRAMLHEKYEAAVRKLEVQG